jgi:general secretion pathway protein J
MRSRAGITLIEAMVSVTILAIVSTLVWQGFTQTARNKQIVEDEADHYHVVRMAMERMQRELSMAYVSAQRNESPSLQNVVTAFVGTDRGGRDRIDFTSFAHQRLYRDAHESDQNEISYFVTRHPEEPSIEVLARREQNRVDDDPRRGGRVQILVEDVEEFQLEYYDVVTHEWTQTWDTTQIASQPNRLPLQVKIKLTVPSNRNPDREQVFATRATLPITFALNHAIYNP